VRVREDGTLEVHRAAIGPIASGFALPALLRLRLERWASRSVRLAAWSDAGLDETGARVFEEPRSLRKVVQDVSLMVGRRRRSLPEDEVARAATSYRTAMTRGDPPILAVMRDLGLNPSQRGQAERRIERARHLGLLGRTTPGRKGEHPVSEG
jgi:hypothetical protein